MKLLRVLFLLSPLCFVSCMSLQQDREVFSDRAVEDSVFEDIESRLAQLDARAVLAGSPGSQAADCEALLSRIEEALTETGIQKTQIARLYALSGRVQLLNGRKNPARDLLDASAAASKNDVQAIILASRLGKNVSLEAGAAFVSAPEDKALLTLERAIQSYAQGNYKQSAALFDTAFITLNGFYRSAYKQVRDRAWELRSLSDAPDSESGMTELLHQSRLSAGEALRIVQASGTLLYPFTGGKSYTQAELFRRISKAGLFSAVGASTRSSSAASAAASATASSVASAKNPVVEETLLTRRYASRLLWHLYVAKKNVVANMYSSVYRAQNLPSPVADISASDADFDAVLGCVENEIMSLTDGVHFAPETLATAVEFRDWLLRIQ
ncbi:MAG: hypothetical protein K6G80_05280 [Treponema sp.]|nr:hypothetical protein [Treponema sp.]